MIGSCLGGKLDYLLTSYWKKCMLCVLSVLFVCVE